MEVLSGRLVTNYKYISKNNPGIKIRIVLHSVWYEVHNPALQVNLGGTLYDSSIKLIHHAYFNTENQMLYS